MAPWRIMTGSGLVLLTPSCTTSRNHNLQPSPSSWTAEVSLHSRSLSTLHLIPFCTTYTVSRRAHSKYIRCPTMDICEPHWKHFFLYEHSGSMKRWEVLKYSMKYYFLKKHSARHSWSWDGYAGLPEPVQCPVMSLVSPSPVQARVLPAINKPNGELRSVRYSR
jgi:hypothetical protein